MGKNKRIDLKKKYEQFMKNNNWMTSDEDQIIPIMRKSIIGFMKNHKNVAIYGYGRHTEQLMLDFVAELRDVKIVVDNYFDRSNQTGYKIIREREIGDESIDGIIISVFIDREKISEGLNQKFPNIDTLDFYELFREESLRILGPYYRQGQGGGAAYREIGRIQSNIKEQDFFNEEGVTQLRELIGVYCAIKDFGSAEVVAKKLYNAYHIEEDKLLLSGIKDLYESELKQIGEIQSDNVYMLCIDGLRRRDLTSESMPKLYRVLSDKGIQFDNAYSYSTSTYESLIPAYSENTDQRTCYYETSEVEKAKCRFIEEAKKQGRKIILNTGTGRYFNDSYVDYRNGVTTITENLWDFVITASGEDNLLYYSQPQCESHFPFYNPYTDEPVLDGTAILFDYLDKYGNNVRTDYEKQHSDALRYIDNVLSPMIERLKCRFLVFSDHGSITLRDNMPISDVNPQYFGSHEDWIRIPMFLSNNIQRGRQEGLTSLLDINDIIISLLKSEEYIPLNNEWVKIGRSAIYNPDFQVVYKKANAEHYLLAFEGFVFEDGYKLIVYSDGTKELYNVECDEVINDDEIKEQLFNQIKSNVTVVE